MNSEVPRISRDSITGSDMPSALGLVVCCVSCLCCVSPPELHCRCCYNLEQLLSHMVVRVVRVVRKGKVVRVVLVIKVVTDHWSGRSGSVRLKY